MSNQTRRTALHVFTPETHRVGDIVRFTDKRGRECTAEVINVWLPCAICFVRSVEGLTERDLLYANITAHHVEIPWSDGRTRRDDEMPGGSKYLPKGS